MARRDKIQLFTGDFLGITPQAYQEFCRKIQEEIPAHERSPYADEEAAFTQAALEQREWFGLPPRGRLTRRR